MRNPKALAYEEPTGSSKLPTHLYTNYDLKTTHYYVQGFTLTWECYIVHSLLGRLKLKRICYHIKKVEMTLWTFCSISFKVVLTSKGSENILKRIASLKSFVDKLSRQKYKIQPEIVTNKPGVPVIFGC